MLRLIVGSSLAMCGAACGVLPERVSHDDPRLRPMFDAIAQVDRRALGFTPIPVTGEIRAEFSPRAGYDAMLHIYDKTSRTIAFRRTASGYEWIHEQEIYEGPLKYSSPDGEFNESITITYETVPIAGGELNTINASYLGERPELRFPRRLTLEDVRPWLKKWGY